MKASRAPGPVSYLQIQQKKQAISSNAKKTSPKTESSVASSNGIDFKNVLNSAVSWDNLNEWDSAPITKKNIEEDEDEDYFTSNRKEANKNNIRESKQMDDYYDDYSESSSTHYNNNQITPKRGAGKSSSGFASAPAGDQKKNSSASSSSRNKISIHDLNNLSKFAKNLEGDDEEDEDEVDNRYDERDEEIDEDFLKQARNIKISPEKDRERKKNNGGYSIQYNKQISNYDSSDSEDEVVKEESYSGMYSARSGKNGGQVSPTSLASEARDPPPLPCEAKPMNDKEKLFFSKEPRQVQFKPYTLSQYKMIKPKEYVEFGKMKPDLNTEELIEKRKKQERMKEFSKQLRKHNQEQILSQPKQVPSSEQVSIEISNRQVDSKRTKMLEFAKNIPKPVVSTSNSTPPGPSGSSNTKKYKDNSTSYPSSSTSSGGPSKKISGNMYIADEEIEAARLDELERKHLENKKKLEEIKRSLKI